MRNQIFKTTQSKKRHIHTFICPIFLSKSFFLFPFVFLVVEKNQLNRRFLRKTASEYTAFFHHCHLSGVVNATSCFFYFSVNAFISRSTQKRFSQIDFKKFDKYFSFLSKHLKISMHIYVVVGSVQSESEAYMLTRRLLLLLLLCFSLACRFLYSRVFKIDTKKKTKNWEIIISKNIWIKLREKRG